MKDKFKKCSGVGQKFNQPIKPKKYFIIFGAILLLIGAIGGTYAFINLTLLGNKRQVITAGILSLQLLEDENNLTIQNALPMYDEVGMIQDPFTFRLINNGTATAKYKLKLVDITPSAEEHKCSEYGVTESSGSLYYYPDSLREEALAYCQYQFDSSAVTEQNCLTTVQGMGAPFTTFEQIIDDFIARGALYDTRVSLHNCVNLVYPESLRQEALNICKSWFDDGVVNTEEDCLIAIEGWYPTFEAFIDEAILYGEVEDTRFISETYPDNTVDVRIGELYFEDIRYGLSKNGETTIGYIDDLASRFRIEDPVVRDRVLNLCKTWYPSVTDEASCVEALGNERFETFDDVISEFYDFNGGGELFLDVGEINGGETLNYDLRLWISEYVEDNSWIEGRVFSFKLEVEVSQIIESTTASNVSDIVDTSITGDDCIAYNDGVDTFLVGQCSNNYVWYSGKLWRVVLKNNATGAVKMVTDNAMTIISFNKYNTNFDGSYVDQWLSQEFLPTLNNYEDYLVINSIWDATADSSNKPARPNGTTTVERTVGLLNAYEYYTTYAQAGGLTTPFTGYLNNTDNNWTGVYWSLITPDEPDDDGYCMRGVNAFDGALRSSYLDNMNSIRPAVNLKSGIKIDSGSGSESDPYILNGDISQPEPGSTLLSTRYSGEYITFNNELYRIVGVENGLTKITAVDKPSSLASNVFHSATGVTSFANADIKTDLETYYQSLDDTWKNMIEPNTTWYLGTVESGAHYKASICATVDSSISMNECSPTQSLTQASIGLPRVGEMFTSQITRGEYDEFWTLTPRYSTSDVNFVAGTGFMSLEYPTHGYGARPSMYLKANVKIARNNTGNGTYEHPYSVEIIINYPKVASEIVEENLGDNCAAYNDGTDTFLAGDCVNNYVWYSGKLWRVVLKNNETGAVKMVTDNAITTIAFNEKENYVFENSYVDQWLSQEFLPTLHDYDDYLVTNYSWDATTNPNDKSIRPDGTTTVTRTVGLLNAYETYVSSYLNNQSHWWTLTPYRLYTGKIGIFSFDYMGNFSYNDASWNYGVRPSVNLKSEIQIDSGKGTQTDPYILKGDIQEATPGTTLLSTRYSGEYLTFNDELYRIVGVENGLTKITAVEKPSSLKNSYFNNNNSVANFDNAKIKTTLETYYQDMKTTNEAAYNMIQPNTTWYLGTVGYGVNYKASICANIDASVSMNACADKTTTSTASIALPRLGEMFTSQIIRGVRISGSTKDFWILTPADASSIYRYNASGLSVTTPNASGYGARPSMYLKTNVKIASNNTGNGTYEHPYSIELGA